MPTRTKQVAGPEKGQEMPFGDDDDEDDDDDDEDDDNDSMTHP